MLNWKVSFLRGALVLLALAGCLGAQEPAGTANSSTENKFLLRQILIGESMEAAQAMAPVPGGGLVVLSPALAHLDRNELTKRMAAGENQVINEKMLVGITQVVENFFRQQDLLVPAALVPNQNIADGTVRIALMAPTEKKHVLRQILIGESVEAAQAMSPVPGAGLVVLSPALPSNVDRNELAKRLAGGENQVINEKLLAAIAQVVENFFRQQDILVPTALVPNQNIADGSVRIALLFGKLRNVKMQGNHWFSESLLRQKLRLEQGETLRLSELDRAINWTNNNPFRRVQVQAQPVPNTGEVDVTIAVQEARPLRFSTSYDNSGNPAIGRNRFASSISYANMWGQDHQASYQYVTGERSNVFQAHVLEYRIPLKWRHYLQLNTSYSRARPEFYGGIFAQDAETVTSDLRYTVPLRTGDNPIELYSALNFKHSRNQLDFFGEKAFATDTDIFQVITGASMLRRDKQGVWAFGVSLTASPGHINSRNSNLAFNAAGYDASARQFRDPITGGDASRLGAKASYLYGGISIQRLQKLAPGWEMVSRLTAQASQANLLATEEFSVGGTSSIRGFQENIFSGDNGFIFSNEIMAPSWKLALPRISKTLGPLDARGLTFFDLGKVSVHRRYGDPDRPALASAGLGLRASLATNFSLSFDYGWQFTQLPASVPSSTERRSRGHIKATLAF